MPSTKKKTDDEALRDSMMAGSGIVPAEEPTPKAAPSYRVMSVDPKLGDIDEQFALIETDKVYGGPASDPTMRKIRVGDSLPEGEVTAITGEGIRVIPDEGDEYVIPLGGREGYKPPEPKQERPFSVTQQQRDDWLQARMAQSLESGTFGDATEEAMIAGALAGGYVHEDEEPNTPEEMARLQSSARQEHLNKAAQEQGKFYDTDDPNEVNAMVQEDFATAFEDDKTLEMTQYPEGTSFLFQDEDGNLSSYFQDYEGDSIRTTPEPGTIAAYNTPTPRQGLTRMEEFMAMYGIGSGEM